MAVSGPDESPGGSAVPARQRQRQRFVQAVALLVPFVVWNLLTGNWLAAGDNWNHLTWVHYHILNIGRGVFPLWNPFMSWGMPDILDARIFGEFNPFLYLINGMTAAGVPFAVAFRIYAAMYFGVGMLGFYVLARDIFRDARPALLAYVMLMFSSLGLAVYLQWLVVLIFVPGVWCFVFGLRFWQRPSTPSLLGLTLTGMVMASTYMPFHFLAIAVPVVGLMGGCYRRELRRGWSRVRAYGQTHRGALIVCCASVLLAALPALRWYQMAGSEHYVLQMGREAQAEGPAGVAEGAIQKSGIATEISPEELFVDLDLGHNQFFMVSLFLVIVLLLSVVNPWNRRLTVLFFPALFVFLLGLADVTPLQPFLYRHVGVFRLFRNYFYFLPLLLPLVVLFAVEHLRLLLSRPPGSMRWRAGFVWLVHAGLLAFLLTREVRIIPTSYLTLGLSAIAMSVGVVRSRPPGWMLTMTLAAVIMLQPAEQMGHFARRVIKVQPLGVPRHPKFAYVRPPPEEAAGDWAHYEAQKIMRDTSGFYRQGYIGTRFSYQLHTQTDPRQIAAYVRHKAVVYDTVSVMANEDVRWPRLEELLGNMVNRALVFDAPAAVGRGTESTAAPARARALTGPSEDFEVTAFDLQYVRMRTDWPARKFLVFNDSFYPGWRAFVDGNRVPLYRANFAFKGLWVEPGRHIVELRYGHPAWLAFCWGLLGYTTIVLLVVVIAHTRGCGVVARFITAGTRPKGVT